MMSGGAGDGGGDWERKRLVTLHHHPQPRQQYPTAIIEKEIGTKRHQKCSWELDIGSPRDRVLRVVGITQSWVGWV